MSLNSRTFAGRQAQADGSWPFLPTALVLIFLAGISLMGCGAKSPVVYEGGPYAKQDIDECIRLARSNGADAGRTGDIARDTATGAAIGAAATGLYPTVRGYSNAGNHAAAGAAAGGAARG